MKGRRTTETENTTLSLPVYFLFESTDLLANFSTRRLPCSVASIISTLLASSTLALEYREFSKLVLLLARVASKLQHTSIHNYYLEHTVVMAPKKQ